jgi:hypothetical protein
MTTLASVTRAASKAVSAGEARDATIRAAVADGATIRAVAAAAGLSAARVHQIVHQDRGEVGS